MYGTCAVGGMDVHFVGLLMHLYYMDEAIYSGSILEERA
jgi:hypothetical protein